jgi:hypothetical protein
MIEILAAADTSYLGFFTGDWLVFGLASGIYWAFKDNFSFGPRDDDDEQHYY